MINNSKIHAQLSDGIASKSRDMTNKFRLKIIVCLLLELIQNADERTTEIE